VLAGAGRDVRVVVGTRYRLHGLLAGAAAPSAARHTVRTSWRLVGAARLSLLGKRRRGPGAPRVPALSDPAAQRPIFKPDVAGRYTLRLTARGRRKTASGTVTLLAVPATPRVPVETAASGPGGEPGFRVGNQFYAEEKLFRYLDGPRCRSS
jgi:hypothetical protein